MKLESKYMDNNLDWSGLRSHESVIVMFVYRVMK